MRSDADLNSIPVTSQRAFGVRCLALLSLCASAVLAFAGSAAPTGIPTYGYEVVHSYPHDVNAFTQGLFYRDGFLYESTGLLGKSTVRKVRLETGEVLLKSHFPADLFGEGITYWDDRLVALTWRSQVGFVLDLKTFTVAQRFSYPGEGWGLARNDREIIMSDGTAELRLLDPQTFREVRRLRVTAGGKPVDQLNELEWVDGEIFANVWQTDRIARIDPKTGHVVGWIDLRGLLPQPFRIQGVTDVLNGIAYDAPTQRLFVTGKLWPRLFEIRLVKQPKGSG
jgi:glutaminyl-peptide cyclotransferase